MITGWKHLSQLLKQRPSLYLMALCSLMVALPTAMVTYLYIGYRLLLNSLSIAWVLLATFFCINSIIGYAIDTYIPKDRSLITWIIGSCVIFVLLTPIHLFVWFFWYVVLRMSVMGGAIYIISSYSRIVDTAVICHGSRLNQRLR
jgi:hypothetical protein